MSSWVAPLAAENYFKWKDVMITCQMHVMADDLTTPVDEGAIYDQVLGKRKGYNRGLANGVMPKSTSSDYNNSIIEELRRNAEDFDTRLEEAERSAIEAERRNEEVNVDICGQARKLDELEAWKDKMEAFMSKFGASVHPWKLWS